MRIPKLLVPFVVIVIGIATSVPCAVIELPVINNSAVALPISRFPTTAELPVIVVAPALNVPPILTAPVELIARRETLFVHNWSIPVPLLAKLILTLSSVPIALIVLLYIPKPDAPDANRNSATSVSVPTPYTFILESVAVSPPIPNLPPLLITNLYTGVPEVLDDIINAPVLALLVIIQSVDASALVPLISSIEASSVVIVCNLNVALVALYIWSGVAGVAVPIPTFEL